MHRTLQRALAVGTTAALALSALTASAPTASAAAPSLTKAANYLVRNLPTSADGVGTALTTANALSQSDTQNTTAPLRLHFNQCFITNTKF